MYDGRMVSGILLYRFFRLHVPEEFDCNFQEMQRILTLKQRQDSRIYVPQTQPQNTCRMSALAGGFPPREIISVSYSIIATVDYATSFSSSLVT